MSSNNVSVGIVLTLNGQQVNGQLQITRQQIQQLTQATNQNTSANQAASQSNDGLISTFKRYKEEVLALAAAYGMYKVADYIKDATLLAARYETMGIVMHVAGNNVGYTSAQMDAFDKSLQRSGISMLKSREALTAMAAANLDLTKNLELGRMAQDLAVVSGLNSSETLARLVTNIQQADTVGLRFMGVTLNMNEALNKFAKAHGLAADALTHTQRNQAVLNAVLQDGAKYSGIYEEAMTTAGKAMTSLERYFDNLKVKVGTPFLEGFAKGIFATTDGVKELNKYLDDLEKNGTLEEMSKNIGSFVGTTLSIIGDIKSAIVSIVGGFIDLGKAAAKFFNDYLGGMKTIKYVTIAFALLLSGYLVEQAVIGFNGVALAAWACATKVGAAFTAMVAASRNAIILIQLMFTGSFATAVAAARLMAMGIATAIASIPALVGAIAVAAGIGLGMLLANAFGDTISKHTPKIVADTFEAIFKWIDEKTHGGISGVDPVALAKKQAENAAAEAKARANSQANEAKRIAAAKAKQEQERLDQAKLMAVKTTQLAVAAAEAQNTQLKALDAARDADLKRSLDQRQITTADYLRAKMSMEVKEQEGELNAVRAQMANLKAAIAAPASTGTSSRDDTADKAKVIALGAQELALQTKINATKSQYAYEIGNAMIEDYIKEFGAVAALVDSKKELLRSSKEEVENAGKTAEQLEMLRAQRLRNSADELEALMVTRQASGKATQAELNDIRLQLIAMRDLAEARTEAAARNLTAQLIADAKTLSDETIDTYNAMKTSWIGTEEERIVAAANATKRIMEIRKNEQSQAMDSAILTAAQNGDMDKARELANAKKRMLDEYANYVEKIDANTKGKVEQASQGFKDLAQIMAETFDPNRIQSFGDALSGCFGNAGDALGKLVDSFSGFQTAQMANERARVEAQKLYGNNASKLAAAQSAITAKQQRDELAYYSNIAGAAKGFFNENSKGYKVLEAVQIAFHAMETALAMEAMAKKIFASEAVVAAEVSGSATKIAAQATATGTSVAMAGTEASAWGVTAVVKAIASLPFPMNLAAGAATLAAIVGLGVKIMGSVGGGSAPSLSEQRQAAQGTGTVLGDSVSKSESIARSMALTAANSSTQIDYLSGMLATLRNIETNIGSFASLIVRTTDISNPKVSTQNSSLYNLLNSKSFGVGSTIVGGAVGAGVGVAATVFTNLSAALMGPLGLLVGGLLGKYLGSALSSVFGGKQSLQDSGFTMDRATLASISANGARANSYADIKTSGGWFSSDKTSTQSTTLGADANNQFTKVVTGIGDSITQAAKLLGLCGDDFTQRLNNFVVDIGKVSLKGLTGDEIQKQLEAVFSKLGDQMASYAIGGLDQFQKVGEGYLETLTRIATDYAKMDASLTSIGMVFGKTGLQSIAARESLIDLMGGIDKFQSVTASFAQNFLTKAEQLAPVQKYVTDQLNSIGLGWIKTRDDFKKAVLGLNLSTDAGQKLYAALMNLQDAFAATHAATVDLSKSEQDIADERKNWQDQLDELTMTSTQLLAKQRAGLDASNQGIFDQVQALKAAAAAEKARTDAIDKAKANLKTAYDKEKQAITTTQTQLQSFVTTLGNLMASSLLGADSPLTPQQKYAEAKSQFQQVAAAAMGGDKDAQSKFESAYNAFLSASKNVYAGSAQYRADFAYAQQQAAQAQQWASKQVDVAQQQLDALNDEVSKLIDLNDSVLDVKSAIMALSAAQNKPVGDYSLENQLTSLYEQLLGRDPESAGMQYWMNAMKNGMTLDQVSAIIQQGSEYQSAHPVVTPMVAPQSLTSGTSNDALVAALTQQVATLTAKLDEATQQIAGLRKDSAEQTAAIVGVTAQSANKSAETISSAVEDAANTTKQANNQRVALA